MLRCLVSTLHWGDTTFGTKGYMARVKPPQDWVTLSAAADQLRTTKARVEQFARDTGIQISEHKPVDTVYQIIREVDLGGFDKWAQEHGGRRLAAIRDEPVQTEG